MKSTLLAALAVIAFPATVKAADVIVRKSDHLAPEDVGIQKYAFEATPATGQVVVFRRAIYRNDRLEDIYDTVTSTRGNPHKEFVVLLDRTVINPAATVRYRLQGSGSVGDVDGRFKSSSSGDEGVTLVFDLGKGASLKYVFTMFLEDYGSAKKRIPKLPKEGALWGFAATLPPPPAGQKDPE